MRKLISASAVLISALLILGIRSRMATHSTAVAPQVKQQENAPSLLTAEEESHLRKLTEQTLVWALTWNPEPTNCTKAEKIVILDLVEAYKQHEGQEVEITLVISETNLDVYLTPLHVWLGFRRFHNLGLSPPTVGYFCENSYDEYVAAQKRMAERVRTNMEGVEERLQADPQMSKIIEQLEKKEAESRKSGVEKKEVRTYRLPSFVGQLVEPINSWSEEKKRLYERIVAVVRYEIESIYCVPGKRVKITVPDFKVGDPEILVLVEAPKPYGKSVQWIKFNRDLSSGEYDAYHAKTHDLWPSEANAPEDLLRFRDLIERKQVKQEEIFCPKKQAR